jgi:L-ascorbate metabolism protein UlaG (beta-lactamase superfamily)
MNGMFEIEYKGANTVLISTKSTSLVFDPKLSLVGQKDIAVKDKVEIVTESRFKVSGGETILFEYPGDYEIGDFSIKGIAARRHIDADDKAQEATIYRVEVADFRIAVLGNIAPGITEDQLEELGVIDILILPIGGNGYTLDATSAAAIVRKVDPKAVIPVHYADSALKYEMPQDDKEVFIKEFGAPVEEVSKYKLKNLAALPEVTTVMVLTRS